MDHPRHIVAVGGLVEREKQVLLIRSPRRGWEFPGGQVEEGEDLVRALQREIKEETGVTVTAGNLVGVYSNLAPPPKVMFGFLVKWVTGEPRTSTESVEVGWFNRDQALEMIEHPAIRDRARDMIQFSGQVVYRIYRTRPYQVLEELFV
jgi:8-oxo-dGTP diphosphatase